MATDATGSPTPKGIPKYNPSVDAPSGLGFNAAMDSIDALMVTKPAGIVSGEAVIWNGTTWVRSSVTKLGINSVDIPAWAAYTPTWASDGTAVTLGNGTLSGYWAQIGKTVHARVQLTMGSTTTFGTGNYYIGLPSNIAAAVPAHTGIGTAVMFDSSAAVRYAGTLSVWSANSVNGLYGGTGLVVSAGAPFVWASGDTWNLSVTYETA